MAGEWSRVWLFRPPEYNPEPQEFLQDVKDIEAEAMFYDRFSRCKANRDAYDKVLNEDGIRKVLSQVHMDHHFSNGSVGSVKMLIALVYNHFKDALRGHQPNELARVEAVTLQLFGKTPRLKERAIAVTMKAKDRIALQAWFDSPQNLSIFCTYPEDKLSVKKSRMRAFTKGLGLTPSKRPSISGVYVATVLEYLLAEILETAGNRARDRERQKKHPILLPIDVMQAIYFDQELKQLFDNLLEPCSK